MWLLNEFAMSGLAPCLWQTGIVVASVYWDITQPVVSPQLEQLIAHCDLNSYPLVLAMDSNAQNSLWGSADDNAHGDTLEEFLLTYGLFVHNTVAPADSSIIDLTLS
jgi:hypothetical protein